MFATLIAALLIAAGCSADDAAAPADEVAGPATATLEPVDAAPEATAEPTVAPTPPLGSPTAAPIPSPSVAPTPTTPAAPPTADTPTLTPGSDAPQADPTPADGQPCSAGLAGDPAVTSTARADFDGDGALDQVTTYRVDDAPATWHIRVDTAAGESLDSPLGPIAVPDANVAPLGGADVDGDGATEELFTVVGSGASAIIVTIHQRVRCEIVQAMVGDAPVSFPVGGSIANIAGVQCLDTDNNGVNNTIVAWTGLADFDQPEGTYALEGIEYELRGGDLREVGSRAVVANIAEADFVYGQLTCGALNL